MGRLRDHGHVDVRAPQGLGAEETTEAGTDHHDAVPWGRGCCVHVSHNVHSSQQRPSGASPGTFVRSHDLPGRVRHDGPVTHYDLAVIGTGSGNTIVTKRFKEWRVAIIEEGVFGGTCLNVGCIPSKMFVFPADLARQAALAPALGVDTSYDGARWPDIRDRVFGRIDPLSQDGEDYRHRLPNIDLYEAHCTFLDDHTLDPARGAGGTGEQITADQIVIAAGGRVSVRRHPGARRGGVPHQRHGDAAAGAPAPDDDHRRGLRGRGVRARLLRPGHRGDPGGARLDPAARPGRGHLALLHRARGPAVGRAPGHPGDQGRASGRDDGASASRTGPRSRPTYC